MQNVKVVNNRQILAKVLLGFLRNIVRQPELLRYHMVRNVWQLMKEVAAPAVASIDKDRLEGVDQTRVDMVGTSGDHLYLAALARRLAPATIFEFGTYLGKSALVMARNSPSAQIYTLDLPDAESRKTAALEATDEYLFARWDRGSEFRDQPEAARIQMLQGDSATFDFSPYQGKMDLIFIDASHSYSYVKSDTEAALKMLSPEGSILWHDYPSYPGIFLYINDLAAEQGLRIVHPVNSGLAFYTRKPGIILPASNQPA